MLAKTAYDPLESWLVVLQDIRLLLVFILATTLIFGTSLLILKLLKR